MRINKQYNKRGFTLTELIIVIVIIGILAAVLIPTLTNYIDRARLSNDNSNARNLNMILSLEALEDDVAFYDAEYVIQLALNNGYDLKASAKNYAYWYDYTNNMIKVEKIDEYILSTRSLNNEEILYNPNNKVRALSDQNVLIIDQGSSDLAKAANLLANFVDEAINQVGSFDQTQVAAKMSGLYDQYVTVNKLGNGVVNFLSQFSPSNALYITEEGYFTGLNKVETTEPSGKKTTTFNNVKNVIISPRTENIMISHNIEINMIPHSTTINPVFIPVNIQTGVGFDSFCAGIAPTQTADKIEVIVSSNVQKQAAMNVNNTNINVDINVIQNNTKALLSLNFEYRENEDSEVKVLKPGYVVLPQGSLISVVVASVLKEGCSLDIKNYTLGTDRVYDVKVFDKFGVLYARGTLTYKFE